MSDENLPAPLDKIESIDKKEKWWATLAEQPAVSLNGIKRLAAGSEALLRTIDLMEEGLSIAEMAEALGITPNTIRNRMKKVHELALNAGMFRMMEFKAAKLVQLEDIRQRALREFELSCGEVTRTRQQVLNGKTGEVGWLEEKEFKAGDPRLLEAAGRAIERQAILIGAWESGRKEPSVQVNIQQNNGTGQEKADVRVEIARAVMEQVKRIKNNPTAGIPGPVIPDVVRQDRGAGIEEAQIVGQTTSPNPDTSGSLGWTPNWKERLKGEPILPGNEGGPAPPKRGRVGPDGQIIPPEADPGAA